MPRPKSKQRQQDPPYAVRAQRYQFATPDAVRTALATPGTVLLDVRNEAQIAVTGGPLPHHTSSSRLLTSTCTHDDCPQLRLDPEALLPDKTVTIVLYCRTGRRVVMAQRILRNNGYTGDLLNGGGYEDMIQTLAASDRMSEKDATENKAENENERVLTDGTATSTQTE